MPIPGAVPASMAKRLLAFVIDQVASLLVGGAFVAAGAFSVLLSAQRSVGTGAVAEPMSPLVLPGAALVLALGLFQWWYQGTRGFTVGKRLVGLRTLSAVTGRPVGMAKALVRLLVPAAGVLALGVGPIVVYVSPLFDGTGRRRGWHDKAAGTMVFDVTVGRDPSTARRASEQRVTAPVVARRLESLLDEWASRQSAALNSPSTSTHLQPVPEQPVPEQPVPEQPVPGGGGLERAHEGSQEQVVRGPRSAGAEHTGLIVAVPGVRTGTQPPAPPPTVPPSTAPLPIVPPSTAPLPIVTSPEARACAVPSQQPPSNPAAARGPQAVPSSAGLAPDVEATRLRPARAKVPEVAAGSAQPMAVIDLTDGRRVELTGTALIGRRPAARSDDGDVQLIAVSDPGRSVSKTHLAIGVDRVGVWVRDRDSTNGTVVTLADGQQILCAAEQQIRLGAGASVAFGDYGLTVTEESPPARPHVG